MNKKLLNTKEFKPVKFSDKSTKNWLHDEISQ